MMITVVTTDPMLTATLAEFLPRDRGKVRFFEHPGDVTEPAVGEEEVMLLDLSGQVAPFRKEENLCRERPGLSVLLVGERTVHLPPDSELMKRAVVFVRKPIRLFELEIALRGVARLRATQRELLLRTDKGEAR